MNYFIFHLKNTIFHNESSHQTFMHFLFHDCSTNKPNKRLHNFYLMQKGSKYQIRGILLQLKLSLK
jgi:hypothetical protein